MRLSLPGENRECAVGGVKSRPRAMVPSRLVRFQMRNGLRRALLHRSKTNGTGAALVIKYIGHSGDCAVRMYRHRHGDPGCLEAKDEWEAGIDFTARVLPEKNEERRQSVDRH